MQISRRIVKAMCASKRFVGKAWQDRKTLHGDGYGVFDEVIHVYSVAANLL
jgi:hypothetical protein